MTLPRLLLLAAAMSLACGCKTMGFCRKDVPDLAGLKIAIPLRCKRVAVMPFHVKGMMEGAALADTFIPRFLDSGFTVVERSQLEAVFQELKLNYSGVLTPTDMKRVGEIAHIDALVLGSAYINPSVQDYTLSVRLVHVETAEIIASVSTNHIDLDNETEADRLMADFMKKISRLQPAP